MFSISQLHAVVLAAFILSNYLTWVMFNNAAVYNEL